MVTKLQAYWKSGVRGWLAQRISAIVMVACLLAWGPWLWLAQPAGYSGWKTLSNTLAFKISVLLFFVSLLTHAWLGVRHVLGDYVRHPRWQAWLRRLVQAALAGYALWLILILF